VKAALEAAVFHKNENYLQHPPAAATRLPPRRAHRVAAHTRAAPLFLSRFIISFVLVGLFSGVI